MNIQYFRDLRVAWVSTVSGGHGYEVAECAKGATGAKHCKRCIIFAKFSGRTVGTHIEPHFRSFSRNRRFFELRLKTTTGNMLTYVGLKFQKIPSSIAEGVEFARGGGLK